MECNHLSVVVPICVLEAGKRSDCFQPNIAPKADHKISNYCVQMDTDAHATHIIDMHAILSSALAKNY